MKKNYYIYTLLFLISYPLFAQEIVSTRYKIYKSNLSFEAKLTMGSFEGSSSNVIGYVDLDIKNQKIKSFQIKLEVLALKTGLSLRDKHMYNKYLESQLFSHISFYSNAPTMSSQSYSFSKPFKLKGTFSIHGIKKDVELELNLKKILDTKKSNKQEVAYIKVASNFDINIFDYNIKQPQYLIMKMEPVVSVRIELDFIEVK